MGSAAHLFRQLLGPIWLDVAAASGWDALGERASADLPGRAARNYRLAGVGARREVAAPGGRDLATDRRSRDAVSIAVRLHPAAQPDDPAGPLQLPCAGADCAAVGAWLAYAATGALAYRRADSR